MNINFLCMDLYGMTLVLLNIIDFPTYDNWGDEDYKRIADRYNGEYYDDYSIYGDRWSKQYNELLCFITKVV